MDLTTTPAARCRVVIPAQAGDGGVVNGAHERVRPSCGHKALGYCCLFCHVRLANQYQLELHTAEGNHHIARWCETHGAEEMAEASPPPAWPFREVSRRKVGGGAKTDPADEIRWAGKLFGRAIAFTSRPRTITPNASFYVPSNARIHYATEHPEFVDLCVTVREGGLTDEDRAELIRLSAAADPRPVVVRQRGEKVRSAAARPAPEACTL